MENRYAVDKRAKFVFLSTLRTEKPRARQISVFILLSLNPQRGLWLADRVHAGAAWLPLRGIGGFLDTNAVLQLQQGIGNLSLTIPC